METIRVGIIGAGRFAQLAILPLLQRLAGVQPVGLVSRTPARAQQVAARFGIPDWLASVDELIRRTKPDAAFVLTPPEAHGAPTLQLLPCESGGCCNWPLACDPGWAEATVATPRRQGRFL